MSRNRGSVASRLFFLCGGVYISILVTINCFASPGSGDGELTLLEVVVVVVSSITRLRKSEIAIVCVFRLISASRIL